MAVKVGELYALLRLDDARFKQSLKDAERQVGDLAKKSSAAFTAIAGSITVATVAAANYSDEITGISKQTGLAVESVQALSFAANRANADLGLLSAGMRAFLRRASEAAAGNEQFLAGFEMLGITQQEIADGLHDIEGLFMRVADGIAGLRTEADMAAVSMRVMGEAGRQLVPFLSQGSGAIRAAMRDAEDLGLVMGRDAVANLAAFADEWAITKEQITAMSRVLAVEFLPTVRATLSVVSDGIALVMGMSEETRRLVGIIGSGTLGAVGSFAALTTGIWATTRAAQALATTLKLASGPTGWLVLAGSAALSLAAGLGMASRHARAMRDAVAQTGSLEEVQKELERVRGEIQRILEMQDAHPWSRVSGALASNLRSLREQEEKLLERQRELIEAAEEQSRSLEDLSNILVGVTDDVRTLEDILADHERRLRISSELAKLLGDGYDLSAENLRNFQRTVIDAVEADLQHEAAILKIAAAYREMWEAANKVEEQTQHMIMSLSEFNRLARIMLVRAELGMPLPTAPDHFLGDLPHDARWQAWRILRDVAGDLRLELERLEEAGEAVSDAWLEVAENLLRIESEIKRLDSQLFTQRGERVFPQDPDSDRKVVTETIHEKNMRDFINRASGELRRLTELMRAELVVPDEAIRSAELLRGEMIRLAIPLGGVANLTEEQLRLYNQLQTAIADWVASLEHVPTRLEEIRADMERALGVGMAVEREIARATGQPFDPITAEMDILTRTLRAMGEETGTVTDEMRGLIRDLERLAAEHRYLSDVGAIVSTTLQGFGRNLGSVARVVTDAVRFEGGRLGFDWRSAMISAISVGIDQMFGAGGGLGNSAEALERAADALQRASESWRQTLFDAQLHELVGASPEQQIAELRRARSEAQAQIQALQERWIQFWNAASRGQRIRELEDTVREINRAIRELESGAEVELEGRITELLGVGTRSLQSAVSGAFSAATAEDFAATLERSLEGRVRNAFVTAMLESATMAPLFEQLGDAIREAVMDSDISPDEMRGIRSIMERIQAESEPLYDLLSEFDLLVETTERVNAEFGRLVNVPLGFRALEALRYQSMTPQMVPTFHGGGVMPHDGLANLRGGEVILTPEQAAALGGGMVFTGDITVVAPDSQSFARQMQQYRSKRGLRTYGNTEARGARY